VWTSNFLFHSDIYELHLNLISCKDLVPNRIVLASIKKKTEPFVTSIGYIKKWPNRSHSKLSLLYKSGIVALSDFNPLTSFHRVYLVVVSQI
jgi:hypothetical protein